ncbi:MAG: MarR family transcriptional regulator [Silicimonas sp.]|nr:MarR family transcriptional regulator [Silicimonas sp.]
MTKTKDTSAEIFGFFTEIGIINQLSTALLAKSLPDGVHPSHFSILNHLVRTGEGKAPVRIAAAMQVTKNTMTHSLKVLEDRGFIEVKPDPDDGRAKLVYLTLDGRRFREEAIQNVTAMFERIIGPEQISIMRRTHDDLASMRRHLDDNR